MPWSVWNVIVGIVLLVVALLLVALPMVVAQLMGYSLNVSNAMLTWVSSHALGMAMVVVVWVIALQRYAVPASRLGFIVPGMPWLKTLFLTLAALGASLGFTMLYGLIVERLGLEILVPPEVPDIIFPGLAALLTFEAVAVWTPITEELFFRGFIFAGLASRWGLKWGLIGSAVVFSLFHGHPGVLLPILVTGLLLAWLYHRTGSIWPSVAAHAGQNGVALVVTMLASTYGG